MFDVQNKSQAVFLWCAVKLLFCSLIENDRKMKPVPLSLVGSVTACVCHARIVMLL